MQLMDYKELLIWDDWIEINKIIKANYSRIILLTESNVFQLCIPYFNEKFQQEYDTIIIPEGEQNKNLQSAQYVWEELLKLEADKRTLLICLGGGMITDMGGFCASLYKRGIDAIYFPTSLLCMTDAAIGGKTGVDLNAFKNVIGNYFIPIKIFLDLAFLQTLAKQEWLNGYAEIIKHAIIEDANLWKILSSTPNYNFNTIHPEILKHSIEIKVNIVAKDPFESLLRKKLNFGHTIGHGIESFFLANNLDISHGQAVAAGIWTESYINNKYALLGDDDLDEIKRLIDSNFYKIHITKDNISAILKFCKNDKKTINGEMSICKIISIGHSEPILQIKAEWISEALLVYINH